MSDCIIKPMPNGKYALVVNGKVINKGSEWYLNKKIRKMKLNLIQEQSVLIKEEIKPDFTVSERFEFINTFTSLVANKKLNSFVITGSGGLGKTHAVISALNSLGLSAHIPPTMNEEPDEDESVVQESEYDYIQIKGFSTAKALYRTLYENNGKIIVFDDCDNILKDANSTNLLKAALDSYEERIICWSSEKMDDLPKRFYFTGRVIFISNLSLSQFPQPIISRSIKVDLTLTVQEKLERIYQVFAEIGTEKKLGDSVVQFLSDNSPKIKHLDIRSAINVLTLAKNVANWQKLALYTVTV